MGFIADLSRYDPTDAVDQYDGVILNIEDPGFAAKRDRATAKGVPWGTYSWVYPGRGAEAAQRAHDAGSGPLGAWLDYEQEGVTADDLRSALATADQLGLKLGVYTYLYILPTVEHVIGDHPLWLAYYPGANDGSYQGPFSIEARAHGALLHQFTSSNGTRDLNVVLDEARWSAWTGATPAPTPDAPKGTQNMSLIVGPALAGRLAVLVDPAGVEVARWAGPPVAFGLPDTKGQLPTGVDVHFFVAGEVYDKTLKLIEARSK